MQHTPLGLLKVYHAIFTDQFTTQPMKTLISYIWLLRGLLNIRGNNPQVVIRVIRALIKAFALSIWLSVGKIVQQKEGCILQNIGIKCIFLTFLDMMQDRVFPDKQEVFHFLHFRFDYRPTKNLKRFQCSIPNIPRVNAGILSSKQITKKNKTLVCMDLHDPAFLVYIIPILIQGQRAPLPSAKQEKGR